MGKINNEQPVVPIMGLLCQKFVQLTSIAFAWQFGYNIMISNIKNVILLSILY